MGNFLIPVDNAYLIQCVDAWTDSPVHGEYLIEYFRAVSPEVDAPKFPQTFVVEAVYLCDLSAFVITSYEGDVIGISDLEGRFQRCSSHGRQSLRGRGSFCRFIHSQL